MRRKERKNFLSRILATRDVIDVYIYIYNFFFNSDTGNQPHTRPLQPLISFHLILNNKILTLQAVQDLPTHLEEASAPGK